MSGAQFVCTGDPMILARLRWVWRLNMTSYLLLSKAMRISLCRRIGQIWLTGERMMRFLQRMNVTELFAAYANPLAPWRRDLSMLFSPHVPSEWEGKSEPTEDGVEVSID